MNTEVKEMDKAVRCLYIAVEESIADDIKNRWERVKASIAAHPKQYPPEGLSAIEFNEWMQDIKNKEAAATPPKEAEGESLEDAVMDYPTAARSIALWLQPFCNGDLPYPNMIADAARKAAARISDYERRHTNQRSWIEYHQKERNELRDVNDELRARIKELQEELALRPLPTADTPNQSRQEPNY